MSQPDSGHGALGRVRVDPNYHWVAMVGAVLVGVVLASVHWLGLVVGGALVGLTTASLARALLAGLAFGILVLVTWAALFVIAGTFGSVLAMGQIPVLGAAMGLGLPVLGSLVRGVV